MTGLIGGAGCMYNLIGFIHRNEGKGKSEIPHGSPQGFRD